MIFPRLYTLIELERERGKEGQEESRTRGALPNPHFFISNLSFLGQTIAMDFKIAI